LKRQAEGTAAIASRKVSSYNVIRTATFTGQSGSYSLDKYIALHRKAHNELLLLGKPVPETKKVATFLAGITGEVLSTSKEVVAGSPTKNTNFEACQQYLKTIIFSKSQSDFRPMRLKSEAPTALMLFIQDAGIPLTLVTDNAHEEMQGKWGQTCQVYHIQQKDTVPYSPCQNLAEASLRAIKQGIRRATGQKCSPKRLWCYCGQWVAAIRSTRQNVSI
jgi:hypothetical protein